MFFLIVNRNTLLGHSTFSSQGSELRCHITNSSLILLIQMAPPFCTVMELQFVCLVLLQEPRLMLLSLGIPFFDPPTLYTIWYFPPSLIGFNQQDNKEISLAQTKFNETSSNIQVIHSGKGKIPSATPVANPTTLTIGVTNIPQGPKPTGSGGVLGTITGLPGIPGSTGSSSGANGLVL